MRIRTVKTRTAVAAVGAAAAMVPAITALLPAAPAHATYRDICATAVVAGHRGMPTPTATEDGIRAAENAVAAHAQLTETDTRLSRNGTWYLNHDRTLDRTTNATDAIADATDATLSRRTMNDGEKVTNLQSYLWHLSTDNRGAYRAVTPILDVKLTTMTDYQTRMIVALGQKYGFGSHMVFQSPSLTVLSKVHRWYPAVRTSLVATNTTSRYPVASVPTWVSYVSVYISQAGAAYVGALKSRGTSVIAWVLTTPPSGRRCSPGRWTSRPRS